MLEKLAHAATAGRGDDREAGGCSFKQGVGHAFVAGRQDKQGGAVIPRRRVGAVPGENDRVLEVEFANEAKVVELLRASAENHEARGGMAESDGSHGKNEEIDAFFVREAADYEEEWPRLC